MKKLVMIISSSLLMITAFAQSEKYIKAMEAKVPAIETTRNADELRELANTFERIADAEKTQWLPYYYAALAQANAGLFMTTSGSAKPDKVDPIADKAEELINKAEGLSKDNSEIYVVKKMIATLRMMADPMNRYMQYGPQAQQALDKAKSLNANNPRVYLLEGQDKFYTPEQFGGSKAEAKRLLEEANAKFASFKPASSIDPNWGRGTTQYFLSQIK
jgi:hypothetical protein